MTRSCTVCGDEWPVWWEDIGTWACRDCREEFSDEELIFPAKTKKFRDRHE